MNAQYVKITAVNKKTGKRRDISQVITRKRANEKLKQFKSVLYKDYKIEPVNKSNRIKGLYDK